MRVQDLASGGILSANGEAFGLPAKRVTVVGQVAPTQGLSFGELGAGPASLGG